MNGKKSSHPAEENLMPVYLAARRQTVKPGGISAYLKFNAAGL